MDIGSMGWSAGRGWWGCGGEGEGDRAGDFPLVPKTFRSNAQASLSSAKSQAESSQVHSFIDEWMSQAKGLWEAGPRAPRGPKPLW